MNVKAEIRDFEKLSKERIRLLIPLGIWSLFFFGSSAVMVILNKIHNVEEIDYYHINPFICIMIMVTLIMIVCIITLIPMAIIMTIKANNEYKRTWITKEFYFEVVDGHIYYNNEKMFVNYNKRSKEKRIYVHNMDNHKEPYKSTFYATIKGADVDAFLEYLVANDVIFDKEYLPALPGKHGSMAPLSMSQYRR